MSRIAVVVALLLGWTPALAQVQTGSILVKVADDQGAVVPGATVSLTGPVLVTAMTGTTDSSGAYRFPSLAPGVYSVTVELAGFQTLVRPGIIVSVGQTTPLDLVLRLGALSESLIVTGESPVVDVTSANVNVTMTQQILQGTPGGRDIWSLMEAKMPGLTTSRPDVGGSSGGSQATFSARGTSPQQNAYFVNGISVGSPTAIGNTSFYFDYDAFEEIQVSTGAHDLSVSTPGVLLNMVTRSGGDRYSGKASYFWQGRNVQSSNVDEGLSQFGLRPDSGEVDLISDFNAQLGGPIPKSRKLRFFAAVRDWRAKIGVIGFPELDETIARTVQGSVNYQANGNNRLTGFSALQYFTRPNFDSSALRVPESTTYEDNRFQLHQAIWNSVFSNTAFMEARFSAQELVFPLFQKNDTPSLLDLSTNVRLRNAATETVVNRKRFQSSVAFQYFLDRALGGRHEFRIGVDNQHGPATTNVTTPGDVQLTFRSQPTPTPSTVTLLNTPLTSGQTVNVLAVYAQDSYTIGRLTVTGGFRWELLEAYLPEQNSPPSRFFPDVERTFPEIRNVVRWNDVAPRGSFVYNLTGDGKTAIKGAVGRYLYQISTNTPNTVNRNFQTSATHTWTDLNGDLQFTPNEVGALLSRSGASLTNLDPDLARPTTDELMIGIDREVLPDLKLSVVGTYRQERNLFGEANVGVPVSAYRTVSRVDLGRDGRAGTSDDGVIQVFDQDPATRGQDGFFTTNTDGLNQHYRGIEVAATKRYSNGWQFLTGYTFARTIVNATSVSNPNALINSRGSTNFDRPHTFKVSGSYTLPREVHVGANFRIQSGLPVARTATYGLTQGNVTVNVEAPGAARLDPITSVDARLSKVFRLGGRQLEAMLDGFNLFNANTAFAVRTLTGRINLREGGVPTGALINQSQFLSPTAIMRPRLLRLGLAYRF
ncbi:MAG: carboxypeptidase regulatory-like domain-containing protein [Vicinamibacterales bacterium]